GAAATAYPEYYASVRDTWYKALANPDAVTVAIDCDSDYYELHRLAAFGKLNVFPQTRYADIYAQKRAQIARAWDSGKIIIGTNKVRDEYETIYNPDGTIAKEADGSDKRRKTGQHVRQGFPDQDYLWVIQIRHLYEPPRMNKVTGKQMPAKYGIRILKCKPQPELQGTELWDDLCCF